MNVPTAREGDHTLVVRGIDPEGNIDPTPASAGWLVDLTPPDTVITSCAAPPAGGAGSRDVRRLGPGRHGYLSVSRRFPALQACITVPHPSADGRRAVIYVRALDRAGNVDPMPAQAGIVVSPARAARNARHRVGSRHR